MTFYVTVGRYVAANTTVDAIDQFFARVEQLKRGWELSGKDLCRLPEIQVRVIPRAKKENVCPLPYNP